MAQPTRCDGQVGRWRLSHNNLRRKQWRRRQRAAAKRRLPRSASSSKCLWGCPDGAPLFFYLSKLLLSRARVHRDEPAKRDRQHPGRRARRQSAPDACGRNPAIQPLKGGTPHGEEGKRRKEKGGEEEVSSLLAKRGGAIASPFSCTTETSSRPRSGRGE